MATHDVKYICGCGFNTVSLTKAMEHSDSYGHQMTAQGVIKPDPSMRVFDLHKNNNNYTPPPRPQKTAHYTPRAEQVEQNTSTELCSSFDALRKKLTGGR